MTLTISYHIEFAIFIEKEYKDELIQRVHSLVDNPLVSIILKSLVSGSTIATFELKYHEDEVDPVQLEQTVTNQENMR